MNYECAACGRPGAINSAEALAEGILLLAEVDNEGLLCLPCYAESESACLNCAKVDDIYPDTSCNAEPWLCRECLELPYRVHMFSCYSDGCMSPAEFSWECSRELEETQLSDEEL